MKIRYIIAVFALFVGITTLFACTKQYKENNSFAQISQSKILHNASVNGIKLPDGTKAIRISKSKVKFIFPKGIQLWYVDNNHKIQKMAELSYTCSCSSSGGCNVIEYSGNYGCMQGGCGGSCTGTPGKQFTKGQFTFVNLNRKISPILNRKEYDSLPFLPGFLLSDAQVKNILLDYAKSIYKNNPEEVLKKVDNNKNLKSNINHIMYVGMKIFGYKFVYGISVNDLTKEKSSNNEWSMVLNSGNVSCSCGSGSSGCTPGSKWGVRYCKGGSCTSCTMENPK